MEKLVHFGAGSIGRGFIGALFAKAGYEVVFIDINEAVLEALNRERCYPVRIVGDGAREDIVRNVRAVNGRDTAAVAEEIASASVIGTSVGANALKGIVPALAAGLLRRWETGGGPVDCLICENLMDADLWLRQVLEAALPEDKRARLSDVGLVETSIARMVPPMTPQMQEGNILRVWVEAYEKLPVDAKAMRAPAPKVPQIAPYTPFRFYLQRKLYIHNLGHASCSYWGRLRGYTYIHEAIRDPDIREMVYHTMFTSALALSRGYDTPLEAIVANIEDLLLRFANEALMDTVARVGYDTRRKLAPGDRFTGAAVFCREQGVMPVFIASGMAAALLAAEAELGGSAEGWLGELTGFAADDPVAKMALGYLAMLRRGDSIAEIVFAAAKERRSYLGDLV